MAPPGSMTAAPAPPVEMKSKMAPPGMEEKKPGDGKVSPEDAEVVRSDAHCIDCTNYDPTSGECSKVQGSFDPQDACAEYFSAINSDEPDDDNMGGAPDMDEDDAGMAK